MVAHATVTFAGPAIRRTTRSGRQHASTALCTCGLSPNQSKHRFVSSNRRRSARREGNTPRGALFPSVSPLLLQLRLVSMIFTSGPREIFAINPRFECCLHRRDILSRAERISEAASSPVREDDVMLKNRNLAAVTARFSSWLYRIRSSRVTTIQRFAPASLSQSTSGVP